MKPLIYIAFISIFLFSCKKQKGDNTVLENVTVHGNVRNNCTGLGFSDVKVKFTVASKDGTSEQVVLTDQNGDFSFPAQKVYMNSSYNYYLSIDSYTDYDLIDGMSHKNYEFFGIGKQKLDKNTMTEHFQIGVSATFKLLYTFLPDAVVVNAPDSFSLKREQRTLHFYEPNRVWEMTYHSYDGKSYLTNENTYIGNYPMGWWHIILDKWKDGIHSVIQDSIYMGLGSTETYTIPW
jgi:hypothetical protein